MEPEEITDVPLIVYEIGPCWWLGDVGPVGARRSIVEDMHGTLHKVEPWRVGFVCPTSGLTQAEIDRLWPLIRPDEDETVLTTPPMVGRRGTHVLGDDTITDTGFSTAETRLEVAA